MYSGCWTGFEPHRPNPARLKTGSGEVPGAARRELAASAHRPGCLVQGYLGCLVQWYLGCLVQGYLAHKKPPPLLRPP
jgi:hypothetical protein